MGISTAHFCGRGKGGSGHMVRLHCDASVCRATAAAWSKEAYDELVALGWRVTPAPNRTVACPEHSGAEPAVDVQQELAL
jgi:hypothetical protein